MDKLSSLLLSVFASSKANLASKVLLLSGVFLPFMSPALHWSSYNCYCYAVDMESYFSQRYCIESIFLLKVPWAVLISCHLPDLVLPTGATITLSVGPQLMYCERKATTSSKSISYLSGFAFTAATAMNSFSHFMPFNR